MHITIDLCTYTTNPSGAKMLSTRFSNWEDRDVADKKEARIFAQGVVCALGYVWRKAAVRINFEDGTTEEITC